MKKIILTLQALILMVSTASSQYNSCKGANAIVEQVPATYVDESGVQRVETYRDSQGQEKVKYVEKKVRADGHGNAAGNQYDLAVDGAFEGQTIVVLQLYTGEGFDFHLPQSALKEKGFGVYRYMNAPPEPKELKKSLDRACQLWIISSTSQMLNDEHLKVIKEFWDAGHGVYIWGDNDPYHADADFVAKGLVGADMNGFYYADKTVSLKTDSTNSGLLQNHLITTGLEYVYEGITISTINDRAGVLTPLLWSSDGNVVASVYEKDGKRLIIDGGFTRLYVKWDTAGTGRYVKNAAAWLVNYEKFGDSVLNTEIKKNEK